MCRKNDEILKVVNSAFKEKLDSRPGLLRLFSFERTASTCSQNVCLSFPTARVTIASQSALGAKPMSAR